MVGDGNRKACPSAERIAAFAERRLSAADAAAVEAHLADCDACRRLFVDVAELLDEPLPRLADDPQPEILDSVRVPARTPAQMSSWKLPKVQMAAAAALVLAASLTTVLVRPDLNPFRRDTAYEELVAAVGTNRIVEGRLTGGFAHGPLRSVTRAPDQPDVDLAVLAAAARIQQDAERARTPDNLHAMGVAELVVGRVDAAVRRLEESLAAQPERAAVLSDLSAAYLARATRTNRHEDYPRALDAAQRAIALDDSLLEAHFNRARAAESLNLRDLAIQSWREYLSRDSGSPWADEARRRLADLEAVRPSTSWMNERDALRATPVAERILVPVPEDVLYAAGRLVEDDLLPRWARAHQENDETGASWSWSLARRLAEDVSSRTEDRLIADLIVSISPRSTPDDLIAAHAAYGDARRHYEADRISAAERAFTRVEPVLTRHQSPLEHWARFYRAVAAYHDGTLGRALELLDAIRPCDADRRYFALCGRVAWMRGLIAATQSRLQDSLDHYQRAVELFTRGGYPDQVGAVENLRADILSAFGQAAQAWRHRTLALRQVPVAGDPRRRHAVLVAAAAAARREGLPRAAVLFQSEALSSAERWGRSTAILEARSQLAQALVEEGRYTAAATEVASAKALLPDVAEESLRRRVEVDLLAAEAAILRTTDAGAAADLVGAAIERYGRSGADVHLPRLHLARARAHAAAGDRDAAQRDLTVGLDVLERQVRGVEAFSARVLRVGAHWDLFTSLAELHLDRGRPHDAIGALERGRSMMTNAAAVPQRRPSRSTPRNAVVLYYMVTPDRLRVAAVRQGEVTWRSVDVPRSDLVRLVEAFGRLVRERADADRVAERLHEIAIAPVADTLEHGTALLIVADGPLHDVPFAAFRSRSTGHYVTQDHPVVIVRSFADAALPSLVRTDGAAFVVADPATGSTLPRLAGASREADLVAATFSRVKIARAESATVESVLEGTGGADWVHIAAHAVLDSTQPGRTRLMLAPAADAAGDLGMDAVSRLPLRPNAVVVLASCRGAASAAARGAALVSLAAAFQQAGAAVVVAPLWDIDDAVTERFFRFFYARLAAAGDVLDAVRAAQQELRIEADSTDVSSWAPFQVYVSQADQNVEGRS